MTLRTTVLLEHLTFPEGPRWHDGRLWFSDIHARRVMRVDLEGQAETVVEVPNRPSGLGWLPDGRLLVVSTGDRRLLRLDAEGLYEVADLSRIAEVWINDMVVDARGRAYIGTVNHDFFAEARFVPGELALATPDGAVRAVASDMHFPNGAVVTPDGRTLIVAETLASRLTGFDIEVDGSLTGRRVWAKLPGVAPDGICLDVEGAVWVASPFTSEALRVREGGEVTDRVLVATRAYACMLGAPDRRTLFVLTAETHDPEETRVKQSGRIEIVEVGIPGAGIP